jgi:hypothetical protein
MKKSIPLVAFAFVMTLLSVAVVKTTAGPPKNSKSVAKPVPAGTSHTEPGPSKPVDISEDRWRDRVDRRKPRPEDGRLWGARGGFWVPMMPKEPGLGGHDGAVELPPNLRPVPADFEKRQEEPFEIPGQGLAAAQRRGSGGTNARWNDLSHNRTFFQNLWSGQFDRAIFYILAALAAYVGGLDQLIKSGGDPHAGRGDRYLAKFLLGAVAMFVLFKLLFGARTD